jgi:2-polyprenyl-3-methyl-5-hydroxy-6-metoxy-1,4-benzoquinol methylase
VRWVERDPHRAGFLDRALFDQLGARLAGTRWLDAGCGEGRVARELARRGASVLGVDVAAPLVAAGAAQGPHPGRRRAGAARL